MRPREAQTVMQTTRVEKGADAAIARSRQKRTNSAAATVAAAIVAGSSQDSPSGPNRVRGRKDPRGPPREKHALERPRCRAATAFARDCHDKKQLVNLPKDVFSIYLDDPQGFLSFVICIVPKDSIWKGATFCFRCQLPTTKPKDYPYRPPIAVVAKGFKYYHPNISLATGKVSIQALLASWSPKLRLTGFCWILHDLLVAPDPEHGVNKRAAADMLDDPDKFQLDVQSSLNGSRMYIKTKKHTPAEEMRFPSKFGQSKLAATFAQKWKQIV